MPRLIRANEATAARRRVYFHLVGADGLTPATGEAGGQPQISTDGAAWTNTGIGTLSHVGNGRYYADLTAGAVASSGAWIETRYKSASTAECPGDSAFVVDHDPAETLDDVYDLLTAAGTTITVALVVPSDGGVIPLDKNSSYHAADGRALTWTSSLTLALDTAAVTLTIHDGISTDSDAASDGEGTTAESVVSVTGSSGAWTLSADVSAAQMGVLTAGRHGLSVRAVLANTHPVTLLRGSADVTA